jgi:hypothetical protein
VRIAVKEVRWEYTGEWEFSGWSVEIKHTKWRGGNNDVSGEEVVCGNAVEGKF